MFQNVETQRFFLKLSLKHEFLLPATCNKIKLIWFCMLQATKFDFKNVAKQNYFAMRDAETFSCNLLKTCFCCSCTRKSTRVPEALLLALMFFCKKIVIYREIITVQKMSFFGVFLVRIFPYSDWIRRDTEYSVRIRENTDQKNSEYGHFSRSEYNWLNRFIWRSSTAELLKTSPESDGNTDLT